jgi:hypothetical protein
LHTLVSLGTRKVLRVVFVIAVDAESAERVVCRDAKLPFVAESLLPSALPQTFVHEPSWRKDTIALRALPRPMAGMGQAFVAIAESILRTRNFTVREIVRRCIARD